MNISDLKQLKINSQLIVTGIFSDTISNPQYATLLALEQVLVKKEKIPFQYDELIQEPVLIREESSAYQYSARNYEEKDIEELTEYARAELIDGKLYMLSAPNRMHQYLITELLFRIKSHISQNKGKCHVYTSPFDVRLFDGGSTVVQPDLLIIHHMITLRKWFNTKRQVSVNIGLLIRFRSLQLFSTLKMLENLSNILMKIIFLPEYWMILK